MEINVLLRKEKHIAFITLNNIAKHNAFDDVMIEQLTEHFTELMTCQQTRVIILNANGKHFCAGADLNWMKRMKAYSQHDNHKDSLALARLLKLIDSHPKTVIASVQGSAFGGGVGLIAACDFALCTNESQFCFSEVKIGLIPAVISPFVIKAIGQRLCKKLFLSGKVFNATEAQSFQLIQTLCTNENLEAITLKQANQITNNAPEALIACKQLINDLSYPPINDEVLNHTALLISELRVSKEGQEGLTAFLEKRPPKWN